MAIMHFNLYQKAQVRLQWNYCLSYDHQVQQKKKITLELMSLGLKMSRGPFQAASISSEFSLRLPAAAPRPTPSAPTGSRSRSPATSDWSTTNGSTDATGRICSSESKDAIRRSGSEDSPVLLHPMRWPFETLLDSSSDLKEGWAA